MVSLVCIGGTLCDRRLFAPMLAALGEGDAVCVDVAHATVEASSAAVLALAPPVFVAIGFSLGAFVALELARTAPKRVAGLVLLSGNARADPPGNAVSRRAQLARFSADGPGAVAYEVWRGSGTTGGADERAVRRTLLAMATDTPTSRFAAQVELAIGRPDFRPSLACLTMPVLAVHGAEDAVCPPDRAKEVAAAAARGSLALVPRVGHFAPLEAPDAVADSLATWLAAEGPR